MGVRSSATWLQAAIRFGGTGAPPPPPSRETVRYMDQNIADYVGRKEKGMVGCRLHGKVEESSGDEEEPQPKRPKKEVVERKGKGKGKHAALAGGFLNTNAILARLTDGFAMLPEVCR